MRVILLFMAIAFARISYHTRSKGHSAVAGAAYRAGDILLDKRTGETHDFKNRHDVVYSKILLPEGAASYFNDRETLWNAVEAAERRSDSQVAKDIILALPRGLDLSHQIDLAHHFAKYHFVRHGLVADIAIHDHGDGNPHAHLYVTTRRLLGDRFDRYKARDLEPDVVRGRVVDPQYWGEQWRTVQNQYFQDHDLDWVVDANHIIAQRHEGRVRGSEAHYLKSDNRLRRAASIDIAVNDPASVLNLLGAKHAVFSERDMALLIHKNTESSEQYEKALLGLKAHRDLILLGPGDDGRDRYTTRANYQREAAMADHAAALSLSQEHAVQGTVVAQAARAFDLNVEQTEALSYIAHSGDVCAVVGRAGTGKSYMMKAARQVWVDSGYQVRGMAVSGIAAKGLEKDTGIPSSTIYSLKMQLAIGSLVLSDKDILVMDEAGMTDLHDMALVMDAVREAGAKLVLVGDHAQLQPVGPGAPYRAIVEQIGFSELNQIQRQDDPGDCAASVLLSGGTVGEAVDYYAQKGQIHLLANPDKDNMQDTNVDDSDDDGGGDGDGDGDGGETGTGCAALQRLVGHWAKDLTADALEERLILAHRRVDVAALNQVARRAMQENGLLGSFERSVNAIDGPIPLSVGDRILFLQNDKNLRVSNGEFAQVLKINGDAITARLSGKTGHEVTFSDQEYPHFNYGYAATVHKSQGVTVDHTFVYVAGRVWDRFLAYVAMTRHRKSLHVYANQSQFKDLNALKRTFSRSVLKDTVLDWPISFAIRRGFDPERILGRFIDTVMGMRQSIQDKWLFVRNYTAFKMRRRHQHTLKAKKQQREMAKKVALFVDLRNSLGAQARLMRQDLKPQAPLYHHHDYALWYEQTLLKNKLAFDISSQVELFERALRFNRVSIKSLEKMAEKHACYLRVTSYIKHHQQGVHRLCEKIARRIQPKIDAHYSALMYETNKKGISIKEMARQIAVDATAPRHQKSQLEKQPTQLPDTQHLIHEKAIDLHAAVLSDDWDKLAGMEGADIQHLVKMQSHLRTCTKRLNKEIYQRSFDKTVQSLLQQKQRFAKIQAAVPNLAKALERHVTHDQPVKIDWLSSQYDPEFKALAQSKDKDHQWLVKLRDGLQANKDTPKANLFITQLESISEKIVNLDKSEQLKSIAPKLVNRIHDFAIYRAKQADREYNGQ